MSFKMFMAVLALALFSAPSFAATTTINDKQIIKIADTANKGEIKIAKLALKNSSSDDVKKFANEMIDDHSAADSQLLQLAQKLKLQPQASGASKSLERDAQMTFSKLSKLKGPAFDQAYADDMVKDHQNVTTLLDNTLIPSATNDELKSMLSDASAKFKGHLQNAQELQQTVRNQHAQL